MVKEDLWGLNEKWEALKQAKTTEYAIPDATTLDDNKFPTTSTKFLPPSRPLKKALASENGNGSWARSG
jgi:hypothetical protein